MTKEQKRLAAKKWREANPEKYRAIQERWYAKNKDKYKGRYKDRQKLYNARRDAKLTPEQKKDRSLRNKYGITLDDYNRMWQAQGGCCAICSSPFTSRPPHVDHDHVTEAVRALLCQHCNHAVGLVFESPETAERLAAYLRKHGK